MNIVDIFPTPIGIFNFEENLDKEQLNFINEQKTKTKKTWGNRISLNNYILENAILFNLKKNIELKIKEYFQYIYNNDEVDTYITQSWLNFTEEEQFHSEHYHSNSIISGVYYINADPNFDSIQFKKNREYNCIKIEPKTLNVYNSSNINFNVKSNDLILFPSSVTHLVVNKKGNNLRISLAFNVFIKGEIGQKILLNYLKL
jgi:uncharacterized protein (TIGR02466 family)